MKCCVCSVMVKNILPLQTRYFFEATRISEITIFYFQPRHGFFGFSTMYSLWSNTINVSYLTIIASCLQWIVGLVMRSFCLVYCDVLTRDCFQFTGFCIALLSFRRGFWCTFCMRTCNNAFFVRKSLLFSVLYWKTTSPLHHTYIPMY